MLRLRKSPHMLHRENKLGLSCAKLRPVSLLVLLGVSHHFPPHFSSYEHMFSSHEHMSSQAIIHHENSGRALGHRENYSNWLLLSLVHFSYHSCKSYRLSRNSIVPLHAFPFLWLHIGQDIHQYLHCAHLHS